MYLEGELVIVRVVVDYGIIMVLSIMLIKSLEDVVLVINVL